ncbi:MAG TPA: zinc ribbon domain-containing protein [Candidatus Saccharimonadales bacterium]|nr:zinc ribbon domain-containing protein [Candidatus Saccharimonadales bacterium]
MAKRQICQSCGMPMKDNAQRGTEKGRGFSDKYCIHCYKEGDFTWKEATVEQMRTYCAGILVDQKHWPAFMARAATKNIPKLERWHANT